MRTAGVVLIVLGIVALIYGGFGYNRERTILEVGQVRATATEHKTLSLPPLVGVLAILGGLALAFLPVRRAA